LLDKVGLKKAYLKGLCDERKIIRRRKDTVDNSRKVRGFDCYLKNEEGTKTLVCKTMLLNTFDLGKRIFDSWFNTLNREIIDEDEDDDFKIGNNKEIKEKTTSKGEMESNKMKSRVREWLAMIPKVPSHYCRQS